LPEIDASVRTRVVSWNDAAEMNESVESDALDEEFGVPHILDLHPPHHLPDDDLPDP
jgi:hypothetical protein